MFKNRIDAADQLIKKLSPIDNPVVLSIPRGGVVIGDILAQHLSCRHDVIISKKLGAPHQPELAIGAIAEDGDPVLNERLIRDIGIDNDYLDQETSNVRKKIKSYQSKFRGGKPLRIKESTIIIVDDGLVTGETIKAAIHWLKPHPTPYALRPKLIIAVPVSAPDIAEEIDSIADEFICVLVPKHFSALSQFYQQFTQVEDQEVVRLLNKN